MHRFAALADALDHLRTSPRPGRSGIGAVLVAHGPDTALATELAEALAASLHLPLARIGDWQMGDHDADTDDADAPQPLDDLFAGVSGWSGPRPHGRSAARQATTERAERTRWSERDITALLHDLGGCSVVHLTVADAEAVEAAMPLVDALAVGPHVAVIHLRDGAVSPDLRRRAAAVLPWAVVDPAMRALRWAALGGTGTAPLATAVAELTAAATREQLTAAGFTGDLTAGHLP